MREWLLKEEEKNKVGRPRLADNDAISTAKKLVYLGFIMVIILSFSFICVLKGESPQKILYNMTLEKVFGALENKDGFIVSNYYDKNYDYVMDVKVPLSVRKYQGNYKYTLYKSKKNSWIKKEEKVIDKSKKEFTIKVSSVKNKNVTWKVKLELINASKFEKSFAPSNWVFVDSKDSKKYAYNIFTVRGYYSPVDNRDINIKDSSKISVTTPKNNPRKFIVDLKDNNGTIDAYYTDNSNKKNKIEKVVKKGSKCIFTVLNSEKITYVTIKYETSLDNIKPISWVKDNNYIVGKYTLKPETSYNN